jgi:uncharacterized protein YdaU (DUF1376 family)
LTEIDMNIAPAYQHYAKDFLAQTAINTLEGRGLYITLLDHYWIRGELPNDTVLLARMCGISHKKFLTVWESEVKQYFHDNGEKLEHAELIGQRDFQEAKRDKARKSVEKRWNKAKAYERNTNVLPTQYTTTSTTTEEKEKATAFSKNAAAEAFLDPIRKVYRANVLNNEHRWVEQIAIAQSNNLQVAEVVEALKTLLSDKTRKFPVTPENVISKAIENRAPVQSAYINPFTGRGLK